jgi:hypothetical protein
VCLSPHNLVLFECMSLPAGSMLQMRNCSMIAEIYSSSLLLPKKSNCQVGLVLLKCKCDSVRFKKTILLKDKDHPSPD